ncbi:cell division protein SepF [Micromonospora humida]|uniref:cell division protein SepF n=1 Tax=Micromonospora humida TaxID=2809018 RepID=UPI00366DB65F
MLLLAYVTTCTFTLLALLAGALLIATAWRSMDRKAPQMTATASPLGSNLKRSDLEQALNQASTLNAYTPGQADASCVHWGDTLRYTPQDYERATQELPALYEQGRALSLDVSRMNPHQAIRLVDFCSGVSRMTNGWILRVADQVILLVPGH